MEQPGHLIGPVIGWGPVAGLMQFVGKLGNPIGAITDGAFCGHVENVPIPTGARNPVVYVGAPWGALVDCAPGVGTQGLVEVMFA